MVYFSLQTKQIYGPVLPLPPNPLSCESVHTGIYPPPPLPLSCESVHTGVTKKAMVYFSQETKQTWSAAPADQDLAAEHGEIDGGALWLPGNTVLELQMLPMVHILCI